MTAVSSSVGRLVRVGALGLQAEHLTARASTTRDQDEKIRLLEEALHARAAQLALLAGGDGSSL